MRKLYRELFYIPKYGKVSEKNMLARMVCTIAIVVVCLTAMSITAYAYFSANITSGSNMIKSATFQTEVQVQITDEAGNAVETVMPITSDNKSFRIEGLEVGKTYTVIIKPLKTETSAKTGFVIISDGANTETSTSVYHTQQLGEDKNATGGKTEEIKFYLGITDTTDVYLRAHWGTSSHYGYIGYPDANDEKDNYICNGEMVIISVNGVAASISDDGEDANANETTTSTTEPAEVVYTVVSGDTLTTIAERYSVTIKNLKAYNGLTSDTINVGQTLKIPPADYKAPETTTEQTTTPPKAETTDTTNDTTEPQETTTPSTNVTEPAEATTPEETTGANTSTDTTEPTATTSTTETQPIEETTGTKTTEASE